VAAAFSAELLLAHWTQTFMPAAEHHMDVLAVAEGQPRLRRTVPENTDTQSESVGFQACQARNP
jgi:hypothetical protein